MRLCSVCSVFEEREKTRVCSVCITRTPPHHTTETSESEGVPAEESSSDPSGVESGEESDEEHGAVAMLAQALRSGRIAR